MSAKVKRTDLVNAALEMIDVMELEEEEGQAPIPTDKKTKAKTIERKILEAAEYIEEGDEFSPETTATLKALGVEIEDAEEDKAKEQEESPEPEEEEPDTEKETKDPVNKGKEVYTKNAIKKMNKKKLEEVATGIGIDLDDYRGKVKDLRLAVMDEMGFNDVPDEKVPEEEPEEAEEPAPKKEFPVLEVKAAKKLQDLKDITMVDDRFKKLRKGLGEYKGLEGTKDLKAKMLACFKKNEFPEEKPEKAKTETKKGTAKGKGRGKSAKFTPDQKIEILVEKNPKRKGSASYERFELYKDGMTVKEFLDAGGSGADLSWDSNREFIAIQ